MIDSSIENPTGLELSEDRSCAGELILHSNDTWLVTFFGIRFEALTFSKMGKKFHFRNASATSCLLSIVPKHRNYSMKSLRKIYYFALGIVRVAIAI
jgi:hypothetical protein